MTLYNKGSIVRPVWDDYARGKVVGVLGNERQVEWFRQSETHTLPRDWHINNLRFVSIMSEKEEPVVAAKTIRCKPVENTLQIYGGDFTHVVVDCSDNKIVAAFTDCDDAQEYRDSRCSPEEYQVREVEL